jgi:hypothetical protein
VTFVVGCTEAPTPPPTPPQSAAQETSLERNAAEKVLSNLSLHEGSGLGPPTRAIQCIPEDLKIQDVLLVDAETEHEAEAGMITRALVRVDGDKSDIDEAKVFANILTHFSQINRLVVSSSGANECRVPDLSGLEHLTALDLRSDDSGVEWHLV